MIDYEKVNKLVENCKKLYPDMPDYVLWVLACDYYIHEENDGLNPVVTDSARDTVHPALEIHSTTPVWPGADYSMPKVLGHQVARRDRGSDTGPPRLPSSR